MHRVCSRFLYLAYDSESGCCHKGCIERNCQAFQALAFEATIDVVFEFLKSSTDHINGTDSGHRNPSILIDGEFASRTSWTLQQQLNELLGTVISFGEEDIDLGTRNRFLESRSNQFVGFGERLSLQINLPHDVVSDGAIRSDKGVKIQVVIAGDVMSLDLNPVTDSQGVLSYRFPFAGVFHQQAVSDVHLVFAQARGLTVGQSCRQWLFKMKPGRTGWENACQYQKQVLGGGFHGCVCGAGGKPLTLCLTCYLEEKRIISRRFVLGYIYLRQWGPSSIGHSRENHEFSS